MKQSRTFIPTMRQTPADIDAISHQLLVKAGYIRTNASGVYTFLPLAQKVLRKIENVIHEEMENIAAAEMVMPILQPTGETSGDNAFNLQDHQGRRYALRSSDEDSMVTLIQDHIASYKQLPVTLYQIQKQFRDIQRPKFGLLQSREFVSLDAYSFHAEDTSLHDTFEKFNQAFANIFTRLGLNYRIVNARIGIDAKLDNSLEFIAMSSIGEDMIAYSDSSSYAASLEWAETKLEEKTGELRLKEMEKVATQNVHTVREVADFLEVLPSHIIKTVLYTIDDEMVAVLCRGDHEINERKLKHHMKAMRFSLATPEEVLRLFSAAPGSIGPVKLPVGVRVVADLAVGSIVNGVCGANETGFHLMNVNPERDFAVDSYLDLRFVQEGDPSPDGIGTIRFAKGIKIGRISKEGTAISQLANAEFQNSDGECQPYLVGGYHIGVSRLLAALVEHFHDEHGIKWPKQLAPFDIHLLTVNEEDETQHQLAEGLYHLLRTYRYDVLYDDRQERPGVKFTDADLIGVPIRLTVGKRAADGIIEIKFRETGETVEWQKEEVTEKLQSFFHV